METMTSQVANEGEREGETRKLWVRLWNGSGYHAASVWPAR